MKKTKLLNAPLSYAIAKLGHTDGLTICDAGLPIPNDQECIDLALTAGTPSFLTTVETIANELFIERILLAEELKTINPRIHQQLLQLITRIEHQQQNTITIDYLPHDEFKKMSNNAKAVVRTGECTPYANVICYSGVPF